MKEPCYIGAYQESSNLDQMITKDFSMEGPFKPIITEW